MVVRTPRIKASNSLIKHPGFVAWMAMNTEQLHDCLELRQTEPGNLTDWIGLYSSRRHGQRYFHGNELATEERPVTTTPAQEGWLS